MEDLLRKQTLIELLIAAGASFLIFQLSFIFFLFIVPVLFIGRRHGWHAAVLLGSVLFIAITVQIVVKMRVVESPELRQFIIIYGLSYPAALLTGALIITMFSGRSLFKMLISACIFTAVSVPVILIYSRNTQVVSFLKEQIAYVTEIFTNGLLKTSSGEASTVLSELQPEKLAETIKVIFFRDFIAAYFFLLSGCWFFTDRLVSRKNKSLRFTIESFTLPDSFVWLLIASLAGILLDHLFSLGWWGYVLWNSGLIMLFVYGLKGIGLIKYLFKKHNVTRQKQRSIYMLIFILLIFPGLNLVVLLGIPGLGVSELWVRYR